MGTRSSVVLLQDDRILMVRQLYKGEEIWTFPGGGIEEGETPKQAAIREVYEETGLIIETTRLILEFYNERIKGMYYCFIGTILDGHLELGYDPELMNQEQDLKELKWILMNELLDNQEVKRILPYININYRIENH